jgi:hypothetical protein
LNYATSGLGVVVICRLDVSKHLTGFCRGIPVAWPIHDPHLWRMLSPCSKQTGDHWQGTAEHHRCGLDNGENEPIRKGIFVYMLGCAELTETGMGKRFLQVLSKGSPARLPSRYGIRMILISVALLKVIHWSAVCHHFYFSRTRSSNSGCWEKLTRLQPRKRR